MRLTLAILCLFLGGCQVFGKVYEGTIFTTSKRAEIRNWSAVERVLDAERRGLR